MKRLFVAGLLFPGTLAGQSVGHHLEDGAKDITYVWTAPVRWKTDDVLLVGGILAGTGVVMLFDQRIQTWIDGHPEAFPVRVLQPFREDEPLALLGRSYILAGMGAVVYSAGWVFDASDLRQAGIGCASAPVAATFARSVINNIIGRTRPRFAKGPFEFELFLNDWSKRSFPGGHAGHVMACAAFLNERFDLGVAEPGLYALATFVGFARVVDGAHWTSDTLLGQAYGWAIGKGIAGRYERRNARNEIARPTAVVLRLRFPL